MEKILGRRFSINMPLADLTSLKIGGFAEYWALINNLDELQRTVEMAKEEGITLRVLGKGTNILIPDRPLKGIVIKLSGDFETLKREGEYIEIGAGCPISRLIAEAIKGRLLGTGGIVGIPGTLGGGIMMNAGTSQGSLGDLVEELKIFNMSTGGTEIKNAESIGFSYRSSGIGEGEIVLGAKLRLRRGQNVREGLKKILKTRYSIQPVREKTAGCVFKNPKGYSAGKLIDNAGLKGLCCGRIAVSKKHANFFINLGGGSAEEFICLMDIVKERVYMEFGIRLEPEVCIWRG